MEKVHKLIEIIHLRWWVVLQFYSVVPDNLELSLNYQATVLAIIMAMVVMGDTCIQSIMAICTIIR